MKEITRAATNAVRHPTRVRAVVLDAAFVEALKAEGVQANVYVRVPLYLRPPELVSVDLGRFRLTGEGLARGAPGAVTGCARDLRSALGNLASNAVRYTQHGGVLIAARRRGGRR